MIRIYFQVQLLKILGAGIPAGKINMDSVESAARTANADEFIRSLIRGLDKGVLF